MAGESPTNGELAIMLNALKEHGDEKHRVISEYMKDIRDSVRDNKLHFDNLKEEVHLLRSDLEAFKQRTVRGNESRDTKLDTLEEGHNKLNNFVMSWFYKLMGGVAVVSAGITLLINRYL